MALEIMGNYLIKHVLQCNVVSACNGYPRTRPKKLCFWKSLDRKFVRVPEERRVATIQASSLAFCIHDALKATKLEVISKVAKEKSIREWKAELLKAKPDVH